MPSRPHRPAGGPRDGGCLEAAAYLAETLAELIELARIHRLDMLCYLLDMARMEAEETVRPRRKGARAE